jgi:uncharacterized protein YjbJ (UPF0337 family)
VADNKGSKAKRKAEGKFDQAKGKVKKKKGTLGGKIEGTWDELKGKVKEKTADKDTND